MNEEKRLQRRQRLINNKAYQTMEGLTRYMDRYYLDALIGVNTKQSPDLQNRASRGLCF